MSSKLERHVLKKRSAFLAVAATGKKWVAPGLVLQIGASRVSGTPSSKAPSGQASSEDPSGQELERGGRPSEALVRFGLTASKKVGNAVCRNRARRRLRALAREVLLPLAKPNRDYVLIARAGTLTRDSKALREDLLTALSRMKMLRKGAP